MTLYYIKQDDTVYGCGESGCCGEYQEDIKQSFVECKCLPESEMTADHLQSCNGGGPVLKWRTATAKEWKAFCAGTGEGYAEGYFTGLENGKARQRERIIKLLWANTRTMTSPIDGAVIQSLRIGPKEFEALIKGENK